MKQTPCITITLLTLLAIGLVFSAKAEVDDPAFAPWQGNANSLNAIPFLAVPYPPSVPAIDPGPIYPIPPDPYREAMALAFGRIDDRGPVTGMPPILRRYPGVPRIPQPYSMPRPIEPWEYAPYAPTLRTRPSPWAGYPPRSIAPFRSLQIAGPDEEIPGGMCPEPLAVMVR